MNENITIRPCTTLEEFEQCIQLQQGIWGDSERELVPSHIFVVAAKTGGQVFGAYDDGRMVGYLLGLVGWRKDVTYIHSHMAGVNPRYQNAGIGRKLKLAQRDDALARGIQLIEWTFDPLKLRNAYFNLVRLGAIVRTYLPDVYGLTSSHLDGGRPTDRLLAEWWIGSPRVESILAGQAQEPTQSSARIFVPATDVTVDVQASIRTQFQKLFAQDFTATKVELNDAGMNYILEPPQYFSI
mgnify:CR=1 FL=1